jgi:hypothetical protein
VKSRRSEIHSRVYKIPEIRFQDQRLSSFAGVVILQALFTRLKLKERLLYGFSHLNQRTIIGLHNVTMIVILQLMMGFRRLRDIDRYRDDPMVKRALGMRRLPHVSTISRALARVDESAVLQLRTLQRQLVLDRLLKEELARVTIDFDGSVLSTGRRAEGTAIGYNKKKKGNRSYYPLFCTIAQTAQVFDAYHRPGNVHDSNGAVEFIGDCIHRIRGELGPRAMIESRHDSAFFSDKTVTFLDEEGAQFTISVPFERFPELKEMMERQKKWRRIDEKFSVWEPHWSPKSWPARYRIICVRQKVKKQHKGIVQLGLFEPYQEGYEFSVLVTNKTGSAKAVVAFHKGRGTQERIFAELKSQCQMEYVPVKKLYGNQLYFRSAIMAHNLYRELQMEAEGKRRGMTYRRASFWQFMEPRVIRQYIIQIAGRLTRPGGKLRLTLSGNRVTRHTIERYLKAVRKAA